MARIALVGYSDDIMNIYGACLKEGGHDAVFRDQVREKDWDLEDSVSRMFGSNPDLLHYTSFKDADTPGRSVDQRYMLRVLQVKSDFPILLSGAMRAGAVFAMLEGINYLDVSRGSMVPYLAKIDAILKK